MTDGHVRLDPLPRKLLPFPWLFAGRRTVRGLVARIQGLEHVIEAGMMLDSWERHVLTDGLMVLMNQMDRVKQNDKSEMARLQGLLERLMGLPDDFPAPTAPPSRRPVARPWRPPAGADPTRPVPGRTTRRRDRER
jgi:hypothetical protein